MKRAILAVAGVLAGASRAYADPAVFSVTGHALVPASTVAAAAMGCTVMTGGAQGRLLARDALDDWAVVLLEPGTGPRVAPVFATEVPEAGATLRLRGGERVVVVAASARSYALRRSAGVTVTAGAILVDDHGRWVAMARGDTTGESFEALALAPLHSELRALAQRAVPACAAPTNGPPAPARCAPHGPGPGPAALTIARNALHHNGFGIIADIVGDRFALLRADRAPTARPGCALDAMRVWRLDAATGLALVRHEDESPRAGLPLSDLAPQPCTSLYALDLGGVPVPAVVLAVGERTVRVRTARPVGTDAAVLLDARGALVGLVTARADDELVAARVAPIARFLATISDPREPPRCATATVPEAAADEATAPAVPPGAVIPLGVVAGAVAVHVGADGVYATLANHLSDVSLGCVVRRPGRRSEEVLAVDASANVALFRAFAATQHPDGEAHRAPLPRGEDPPLPLADRRPAEHATLWIAAGDRPLRAHLAAQHTDDLTVHLDNAPAQLPPGSPVLDATQHLVGLLERPLGAGRWRVRGASALRRLLPGLRRDLATQTCYPVYGTPLGAVLAGGFNLGMTTGSRESNGVQYTASASLHWYNTWYFHGTVGTRLSSGLVPRFTIAGGPLFFRSPGDGAVGAGLHIEVEVPLRDAQRDPLGLEAARALYGFEVQGLPYFTNTLGMHLALAAGLAQHGDLTRAALGFGITFTLGLAFGRLRWDRPD